MRLQCLLTILLALASGCSPNASAPPTRNAGQASNATSGVRATGTVAPPKVQTAVEPKPKEAAIAKASATERIVLLSRRGIFVVDLTMSIDGKPFDAPLKELVAHLLQAADVNGDGRPMWEEVVNNPALKSGQYGNLPVNNEAEARRMVQLYDVDRDGEFDAGEAPRFLTRNAGQSQPFSLQSANEYRNYEQLRSLLGLHLDTDHDGVISSTEMKTSANRLRSRDIDDDGILFATDFDDSLDANMTTSMPRRRRRGPDTAIQLDALTRWDTLLYSLEELFGVNGVLDDESFPLTPRLFSQLDDNADGEISQKELMALATIEPHIHLEAKFGEEPRAKEQAKNNDRAQRTPQIKLLEIAKTLAAEITTAKGSAQRVGLVLPGVRLEFFVNDGVNNNLTQQVAAQFQLYDADKNGYLEEDEIPEAALLGGMVSFSDLDDDDDGKAYPEEYTAYLRRRQGPAMSQIRARAADYADTLFGVLDRNHDGRLSEREVEAAPQSLAKLDANSDQRITSEEIPSGVMVGLVRGNVQQNTALFAPPTTPAFPPKNAPQWFVSMDLNADGEISHREFLGSSEQFTALDSNHDGYLELQEAAAKK